jgi:hypothetical protein
VPGAQGWRPRSALAKACHDLAALERLTAQQTIVDGRLVATLVGFRGGLPVFTTTFGWDHPGDDGA